MVYWMVFIIFLLTYLFDVYNRISIIINTGKLLTKFDSILERAHPLIDGMNRYGYHQPTDSKMKDLNNILNEAVSEKPALKEYIGWQTVYNSDLKFDSSVFEKFESVKQITIELIERYNEQHYKKYLVFSPSYSLNKILNIPSYVLNLIGLKLLSPIRILVNLLGFTIPYFLTMFMPEIKTAIIELLK